MPQTLDPIFPLPAGTGIPPVREGDGKKIFSNETHVAAGMPYRSFWIMWEQVERIARVNYPKYVNSATNIAQTYLDAVVWCRQIAHPDMQIEAISETEAAKIRAKASKQKAVKGDAKAGKQEPEQLTCPQASCGQTDVMKSRRAGIAGFKCRQCKHWWPVLPSTSPVGAIEQAPATKAPKKKKDKAEKGKKKGKKAKKKDKG